METDTTPTDPDPSSPPSLPVFLPSDCGQDNRSLFNRHYGHFNFWNCQLRRRRFYSPLHIAPSHCTNFVRARNTGMQGNCGKEKKDFLDGR